MLSAFQKRNLMGIVGVICTLAIPFFIGLADEHIESSQSLCPTKLLTGLPCPGCGITKSLIFLYQGNIEKSMHYHAFGPLVVIASIGLLILMSIQLGTNNRLFTSILYNSKIAYGIGFVLILYHSFRLIQYIQITPFSEILQQSAWK